MSPLSTPAPSADVARHSPQEDGVDDGTRTHDDRNHNPGLYQLSYTHRCLDSYFISQSGDMARPAGLEPATLGLEGRCSVRLSYGRIAESV